MRLETRSTAILVATLALGVVLGMVTQGFLMRSRWREVAELRRPPGFAAHLESVIRPRPEQVAAVRPVLEATGRTNEVIINGARERLRLAVDSMRTQLAPMLDAEQNQRLTRFGTLPDPFRPRPDGPPPPR